MTTRGRTLEVRLISDDRGFNQAFNRAQRGVAGFSRQVDQASRGSMTRFSGRLDVVSSQLRNFAGLAAGVLAGRAITGFAADAIEAFSDLNESANAARVVFKEAADQVLRFGETAATSVGLSNAEFNQLAANIGQLLQGFGLSAGEAAAQTIRLTERAADMASVMNADVADALQAVGAALRGETEPIRRFIGSFSQAEVEAFALERGLVRTKSELQGTAKAMAAVEFIMDRTNRLAGDFANTSSEVANRQRIVQARVTDLRAEVGRGLVPAFEALLDAADASLPTLETLSRTVLPAVGEAAASFVAGLEEITEGFGELPGPVKAAAAAVAGLTAALRLASANPIVLGISAVAGLIAVAGSNARSSRQDVEELVEVLRQVEDFDPSNIDTKLWQLREAIARQLFTDRDVGRQLIDAGALDEAIDLVLGAEDALGRFNSALRDSDLTRRQRFEILGAVLDVREAFKGSVDELEAQREASRQLRLERARGAALSTESARRELEALKGVDAQYQINLETVRDFADSMRSNLDSATANLQQFRASTAESLRQVGLDFFTIFEEAPKVEPIDIDILVGNAQERLQQLRDFFGGVQTLAEAGLGNLAAAFTAEGPQALGALQGVLADLEEGGTKAFELDELIGKAQTEVGSLASGLADALALERANAFAAAFGFGQDFGRQLLAGVDSVRGEIDINARALLTPPPRGRIGGRAHGGPVWPGRLYEVNERGHREFFEPAVAGRVHPSGGGAQIVTNISITPSIADIPEETVRALDRKLGEFWRRRA